VPRTTNIQASARTLRSCPGVLLLFSPDKVLIHVSATGNLREELSTKGPRHHLATHFAAEVIFDRQWRTARAAELAQLLTPRGLL